MYLSISARTALPVVALLASSLASACTPAEGADRNRLVTMADTIADTIVVRNSGGDRLAPVQLVETLRIRPVGTGFGTVSDLVPRVDGGVHVRDRQAGAIYHFDASGGFVRRFNPDALVADDGDDSTGMLLSGNRLVLWDGARERVSVFDSTGLLVLSWRAPYPAPGMQNLHRFGDDAFFLRQYIPNRADRSAAPERGYVAYRWDGTATGDTIPIPYWREGPWFTLQAWGARGGYFQRDMPFTPRFVSALSPRGDLVFGVGNAYEFAVSRHDGMSIRVTREVTPIPTTPDERTDSTRAATADMQAVDSSWSWDAPSIPYQKPFFRRFLFADDGMLWVERGGPSVRVKSEVSDGGAARTERNVVWREDVVYDLFNPDGRFIQTVAPPPMSRIMSIAADGIWGVQSDASGAQSVVRWRFGGGPSLAAARAPTRPSPP